MALGEAPFVPGPVAPGDGALLAPQASLGSGLGALALTGSVAIHATFVIGLLALQPAEAPGVAGENVIEVSVVSEWPPDRAVALAPPEAPAEPFFPPETLTVAEAAPAEPAPEQPKAESLAADQAPPAPQAAEAAPVAAPEFRLALAFPEEPDGLALPAPLPLGPDAPAAHPSADPEQTDAAPAARAAEKKAEPGESSPADRVAQRPAKPRSQPPKPAPPPVRAETKREAPRKAAAKPQAERPAPVRQASLSPSSDARAAAPPPGLDIAAFRAAVAQRVAAMKRYPPGARDRGEEGRPVVAFVIDGAGRLVSVNLASRSGHAELDAETLSMVRRAAPFPPPPPGAPRAFSLGVSFRLD